MKPEQKKFAASVCISTAIVFAMPAMVSVMTMAFFMWTSSYYPEDFVEAVIRSWVDEGRSNRSHEGLDEPLALPQPVYEAIKTVRRLGRRFNSLL